MNIFRRVIVALVALVTGLLANGGHSAYAKPRPGRDRQSTPIITFEALTIA
jgi:hypothetical protein